MRIELKSTREMSTQERARRDCVVRSSFYIYFNDYIYADADWTILVWEGEEAVSAAEIFDRTILVGGQLMRVGGVGSVATKTEWRKRGYASEAMRFVRNFLRETLAVDFGLGFCADNLIPYHTSLGWNLVAHSFLVDQPGRRMTFTDAVMALPVLKEDWPPGEIDLCGLPW